MSAAAAQPLCGIKHGFAGDTCVRKPYHRGRCWGKFHPEHHTKQIIRTEWSSLDGRFAQHWANVRRHAVNRTPKPLPRGFPWL